jgi:chromosome segregation ATPase
MSKQTCYKWCSKIFKAHLEEVEAAHKVKLDESAKQYEATVANLSQEVATCTEAKASLTHKAKACNDELETIQGELASLQAGQQEAAALCQKELASKTAGLADLEAKLKEVRAAHLSEIHSLQAQAQAAEAEVSGLQAKLTEAASCQEALAGRNTEVTKLEAGLGEATKKVSVSMEQSSVT